MTEDRWSGLMADSMRTFADIEALGRRLATSIAEEFAEHGTSSGTDTTSDAGARPRRQPSAGSMHEVTRDLLAWVDTFSDIARDTIFALADVATTAITDEGVSAEICADDGSAEIAFWLHSASGRAEVSPSVDPLRSPDGSLLAARIEPPTAVVDDRDAAEFHLIVDSSAAAPGSYTGLIEAPGVPDGLPVRVEVRP